MGNLERKSKSILSRIARNPPLRITSDKIMLNCSAAKSSLRRRKCSTEMWKTGRYRQFLAYGLSGFSPRVRLLFLGVFFFDLLNIPDDFFSKGGLGENDYA